MQEVNNLVCVCVFLSKGLIYAIEASVLYETEAVDKEFVNSKEFRGPLISNDSYRTTQLNPFATH